MRLLTTVLAIAAISLAPLPIANNKANSQPRVTIEIENIFKDDHIKGSVVGLLENGIESHIVLVYVKTDKWYIHPYAQGIEGKSYAKIQDDGSWTIDTIYRPFETSSVAALVVKKDNRKIKTTLNVRNIPNIAIFVEAIDQEYHPWHDQI